MRVTCSETPEVERETGVSAHPAISSWSHSCFNCRFSFSCLLDPTRIKYYSVLSPCSINQELRLGVRVDASRTADAGMVQMQCRVHGRFTIAVATPHFPVHGVNHSFSMCQKYSVLRGILSDD